MQEPSTEQGMKLQMFNKILLSNMVMSKETILTQRYMNPAQVTWTSLKKLTTCTDSKPHLYRVDYVLIITY